MIALAAAAAMNNHVVCNTLCVYAGCSSPRSVASKFKGARYLTWGLLCILTQKVIVSSSFGSRICSEIFRLGSARSHNSIESGPSRLCKEHRRDCNHLLLTESIQTA
jgi:hypothetical protein